MKKIIVSALLSIAALAACNTSKRGAITKTPLDCVNKAYVYETDIKPVMEQYCTRCHNTNMQAGYNFEDAAYVRKAGSTGYLLGSLKHKQGYEPMPAGNGGEKLDQDVIDKLECWVNNGMK